MRDLPSPPDAGGSRRRDTALTVIIAAVALALGALPILTPPRQPNGIDIERAVGHVAEIAAEPRPMGSPAIIGVREYLVAAIDDLGLDPVTQTSTAPDWFGRPGRTVEIVNVMARIEGRERGDAILFLAHYDTVPTTFGANDDASGVAAILEAGRMLVADPAMRNDVILLFTDAEEPQPRFGASAFTAHPWFDDVALAVNVEGIGEAGPVMLVEMSGRASALVPELHQAVAAPVAYSFLTGTMALITVPASDFDVFRDLGVPGFSLAFARGSSVYHTSADGIDALNVDGMAHQGDLVLGIARHFGGLDLGGAGFADVPGGDLAFTTVAGHRLVWHPAGLVWIVLALSSVGAALAVVIRRRRVDTGSIGWGIATVVGGMLVAIVVATTIWVAAVTWRPTTGVLESYLWVAVVCLVSGIAWPATVRIGRRRQGDLLVGALVVWTALAAIVSALSPAIGAPFAWGLGFAALALGTLAGTSWPTATRPRPALRRVGALLAAVVLMVPLASLFVPMVDAFFLFAGPRPGNPDSELPATAAVSVLVTYLIVGLVASVLATGKAATHGPSHPSRSPAPTDVPSRI